MSGEKEMQTAFDGDGHDATSLHENHLEPITVRCLAKSSHSYKADIDTLYTQLTALLNDLSKRHNEDLGKENTDPDAVPLFWVSKWVDYSEKYGFGYQLCDGGTGVVFNDDTKLILLANGIDAYYINHEGNEERMTLPTYPADLEKKMKLLFYFKRYMSEQLMGKSGGNLGRNADDEVPRAPYMHTWFRAACAVVMHLTNGSVQLNFSDHMKIILCPRMAAVTYQIRTDSEFCTYKFSTISKLGCSKELHQKLFYAHEQLKTFLEKIE